MKVTQKTASFDRHGASTSCFV